MEFRELGDCSPAQLEFLDKFREYKRNVPGITVTPLGKIYDDWFLLRFCRARKFEWERVNFLTSGGP
jgi:hypothetical protein